MLSDSSLYPFPSCSLHSHTSPMKGWPCLLFSSYQNGSPSVQDFISSLLFSLQQVASTLCLKATYKCLLINSKSLEEFKLLVALWERENKRNSETLWFFICLFFELAGGGMLSSETFQIYHLNQ